MDFGKLIDGVVEGAKTLSWTDIAGGVATFGASYILGEMYTDATATVPNEAQTKMLAGMSCQDGLNWLKANGMQYPVGNVKREYRNYKDLTPEGDKAYLAECAKLNPWANMVKKAGKQMGEVTTGASGCSGCRPDQTQYQNTNKQQGSLWYGRILWPGLLAKNTGGDQGGNLFRPVMVGDVWTPLVTYDGAEAPGAPLPDPTSDQLAPGWTRDAFKKAAAGVRPSILAAESQADQPAANLDYFWKAVAKYAPESAAYYINAGVPVPAEVAGTVNTIAAQHAGLSPAALLLLALGAWYLLKK